MKSAIKFLRTHGEATFYALLMAFVTGVIGPSLDRYDQQKDEAAHARTIHEARR